MTGQCGSPGRHQRDCVLRGPLAIALAYRNLQSHNTRCQSVATPSTPDSTQGGSSLLSLEQQAVSGTSQSKDHSRRTTDSVKLPLPPFGSVHRPNTTGCPVMKASIMQQSEAQNSIESPSDVMVESHAAAGAQAVSSPRTSNASGAKSPHLRPARTGARGYSQIHARKAVTALSSPCDAMSETGSEASAVDHATFIMNILSGASVESGGSKPSTPRKARYGAEPRSHLQKNPAAELADPNTKRNVSILVQDVGLPLDEQQLSMLQAILSPSASPAAARQSEGAGDKAQSNSLSSTHGSQAAAPLAVQLEHAPSAASAADGTSPAAVAPVVDEASLDAAIFVLDKLLGIDNSATGACSTNNLAPPGSSMESLAGLQGGSQTTATPACGADADRKEKERLSNPEETARNRHLHKRLNQTFGARNRDKSLKKKDSSPVQLQSSNIKRPMSYVELQHGISKPTPAAGAEHHLLVVEPLALVGSAASRTQLQHSSGSQAATQRLQHALVDLRSQSFAKSASCPGAADSLTAGAPGTGTGIGNSHVVGNGTTSRLELCSVDGCLQAQPLTAAGDQQPTAARDETAGAAAAAAAHGDNSITAPPTANVKADEFRPLDIIHSGQMAMLSTAEAQKTNDGMAAGGAGAASTIQPLVHDAPAAAAPKRMPWWSCFMCGGSRAEEPAAEEVAAAMVSGVQGQAAPHTDTQSAIIPFSRAQSQSGDQTAPGCQAASASGCPPRPAAEAAQPELPELELCEAPPVPPVKMHTAEEQDNVMLKSLEAGSIGRSALKPRGSSHQGIKGSSPRGTDSGGLTAPRAVSFVAGGKPPSIRSTGTPPASFTAALAELPLSQLLGHFQSVYSSGPAASPQAPSPAAPPQRANSSLRKLRVAYKPTISQDGSAGVPETGAHHMVHSPRAGAAKRLRLARRSRSTGSLSNRTCSHPGGTKGDSGEVDAGTADSQPQATLLELHQRPWHVSTAPAAAAVTSPAASPRPGRTEAVTPRAHARTVWRPAGGGPPQPTGALSRHHSAAPPLLATLSPCGSAALATSPRCSSALSPRPVASSPRHTVKLSTSKDSTLSKGTAALLAARVIKVSAPTGTKHHACSLPTTPRASLPAQSPSSMTRLQPRTSGWASARDGTPATSLFSAAQALAGPASEPSGQVGPCASTCLNLATLLKQASGDAQVYLQATREPEAVRASRVSLLELSSPTQQLQPPAGQGLSDGLDSNSCGAAFPAAERPETCTKSRHSSDTLPPRVAVFTLAQAAAESPESAGALGRGRCTPESSSVGLTWADVAESPNGGITASLPEADEAASGGICQLASKRSRTSSAPGAATPPADCLPSEAPHSAGNISLESGINRSSLMPFNRAPGAVPPVSHPLSVTSQLSSTATSPLTSLTAGIRGATNMWAGSGPGSGANSPSSVRVITCSWLRRPGGSYAKIMAGRSRASSPSVAKNLSQLISQEEGEEEEEEKQVIAEEGVMEGEQAAHAVTEGAVATFDDPGPGSYSAVSCPVSDSISFDAMGLSGLGGSVTMAEVACALGEGAPVEHEQEEEGGQGGGQQQPHNSGQLHESMLVYHAALSPTASAAGSAPPVELSSPARWVAGAAGPGSTPPAMPGPTEGQQRAESEQEAGGQVAAARPSMVHIRSATPRTTSASDGDTSRCSDGSVRGYAGGAPHSPALVQVLMRQFSLASQASVASSGGASTASSRPGQVLMAAMDPLANGLPSDWSTASLNKYEQALDKLESILQMDVSPEPEVGRLSHVDFAEQDAGVSDDEAEATAQPQPPPAAAPAPIDSAGAAYISQTPAAPSEAVVRWQAHGSHGSSDCCVLMHSDSLCLLVPREDEQAAEEEEEEQEEGLVAGPDAMVGSRGSSPAPPGPPEDWVGVDDDSLLCPPLELPDEVPLTVPSADVAAAAAVGEGAAGSAAAGQGGSALSLDVEKSSVVVMTHFSLGALQGAQTAVPPATDSPAGDSMAEAHAADA